MKIAISGLSGVGSSSTARLVSQRLNLPMSNFTFRELAKERGISFEELQAQAATDDTIDYELDRRLIEFIQNHESCLIATDLACWLDQPSLYQRLSLSRGASYNYKIWLEAPLEVRAQRMHEREGGDYQAILSYNDRRDQDNRERYLRQYGVDILDHSQIDWILETSQLTLEQVAGSISQRLADLSG